MNQEKKAYDAIVVSHTHWDREWYLTFEEFRYWLVQGMDKLLETMERKPGYRFMLDGQVIPLLDYLAIRPEQEETLKRLIRADRLQVGPWYIQPDEFLVSGEALIRNLILGDRIARLFGRTMKEGYLPDSFGHIAQLPQVLQGFGIETLFVMRGADLAVEAAGAFDFLWEAPDGSRVFTHVMETGYCSGAFLCDDPAIPSFPMLELQERGRLPQEEPLVKLLHLIAEWSSTETILIPNGCDHLEPQTEILEVIRRLNERLPDVRLRQGTLAEYVEAVKRADPRLSLVRGELRTCKYQPVLSGVYSARMYLKQRNALLQTLLERYAEPLAAIARLYGRDFSPFVWKAWELVLQNQAHDSICGTGIDAVHREMLMRYDQAEAIVRQVIRDALRTVGAQMVANPSSLDREILLLAFNPSSQPREEEIVVEVEPHLPSLVGKRDPVPGISTLDLENCTLLDPHGNIIPFTVRGERLVSEDVLNHVKHLRKRLIAFQAALPPLGFKLFRLVPDGKAEPGAGSLIVDEHTLENEFYRVSIQSDGTLTLLDKENDQTYAGLCFIEDSGDAGDEYNYSPPPRQQVLTSQGNAASVQVVEDLPWKGVLRIRLTLQLPKGLTEDRQGRSDEKVDCPVTVLVSLQRGIKRVDIAVEVENNARDHRLRVGFPLGFSPDHSIAEDSFWVVRRPTRPPESEGWIEKPANTHPQKTFVTAENHNGGMAILNRGLAEYEVTEEGTIFLTLLRGVGWLSRDDLSTRRGHAGPPYETPDAQCIGRHRFEFGIYTYKRGWEEARVLETAHAFTAPPTGVRLTELNNGILPAELSFITVEPAGLALSAVKPAEDGDGIIVRVYNPTAHSLTGIIKSWWKISRAESVCLDESFQEEIPVSPRGVPVMLKSGEIKTLRLDVVR